MSYGGPQQPGYGGYQQPGYGGYQQPGYGYAQQPAPNYAGLGKRFAAVLLDSLIVSLGTLPGFGLMMIAVVVGASTSDSRGRMSDEGAGAMVGLIMLAYALIFIGFLAVWLYNIHLLGRDGATLGKRWMKIRVIDQTGQPLGFGKAFLREFVKGVIGNVCGILLLWPLWDQEKQGLYDKIVSTHVYDA